VWVLLICVFGVRELLQGGARPPVFEKKRYFMNLKQKNLLNLFPEVYPFS